MQTWDERIENHERFTRLCLDNVPLRHATGEGKQRGFQERRGEPLTNCCAIDPAVRRGACASVGIDPLEAA
jgi:hypothetical protein